MISDAFVAEKSNRSRVVCRCLAPYNFGRFLWTQRDVRSWSDTSSLIEEGWDEKVAWGNIDKKNNLADLHKQDVVQRTLERRADHDTEGIF